MFAEKSFTDSKGVLWERNSKFTETDTCFVGSVCMLNCEKKFEIKIYHVARADKYATEYANIIKNNLEDPEFSIHENICANGTISSNRFFVFEREKERCLKNLQTYLSKSEVEYVGKRMIHALTFLVHNSFLSPHFSVENIILKSNTVFLSNLEDSYSEHKHDIFCSEEDCSSTKSKLKSIFNVLVYLSAGRLPWENNIMSKQLFDSYQKIATELGINNETLHKFHSLINEKNPLEQSKILFSNAKKTNFPDFWIRNLDYRFKHFDIVRENHETETMTRLRNILFFRICNIKHKRKEISLITCYVLSSAIAKKIKYGICYPKDVESAILNIRKKIKF